MKLEEMEPKIKANQMNHPETVSRAEWLVARKDLLSREKEFTRQRDAPGCGAGSDRPGPRTCDSTSLVNI